MKLADCVEYLSRGKSPDYVDKSDITVINQACIYWNGVNIEKAKYQNPNSIYKKAVLQDKDVLINSTGTGTLGRAAVYYNSGETAIADSHVTIVRTDKTKVVPEFLCLYLRRDIIQKELYSRCVSGSTNQVELSKDKLLAFPVPEIPIEVQHNIVTNLGKISHIIAIRNEELSALDDLIKARFVEMFGDETNPYQWPVVNVEDVASVSVGVVIKPAQYYTDAEHGVKAFRSLNIGAGTIKDSDWVYFSHEGNDKNSKSQLRENDLLIVRSGAPGTACVVPKIYEGCNAIDIIIARPETDKVNPHFLCTFTNLPHGKRQIDKGTGGAAQQHFNVGKYNKLQLMLPPLKKQNEFVSFLEQTDKSK